MALVNAQEHDVAIKSLLDALEKAGKATPILTGCEAGRGYVLRVKRQLTGHYLAQDFRDWRVCRLHGAAL